MDYMLLFFPALFCVDVKAAPTARTWIATEGGNVTLWKGLTNQTHAILSRGLERATLLNFDNGSIKWRKDNIFVVNGDIVMTNVQKNDSNFDYELQIIGRDNMIISHYFELNVTARLHQDTDYTTPQTTLNPPPETEGFCRNRTACVSVGLVAAAVTLAALVLVYWKWKWIMDKIRAVNRPHFTLLYRRRN